MTFGQVSLAVAIAAKGSISTAAQIANISQPNASQAIKKLEKELGYPLFKRADGGMIPTEEGYRFLNHAEAILREKTAIDIVSKNGYVPRLHLGVMNFTPAVQAFIRFCNENINVSSADLMCLNVITESGARLLKERQLDLVVSIIFRPAIPQIEQLCRENRLEMHIWKDIPVCIRVRKDHPLILSGELDGSPQCFNKLSQYPYIEYLDMRHILPTLVPEESGAPFGYSYPIYTDERESRMELMSATNAYTVGCELSKERMEKYGLVSVPVGQERSTLITLNRKGDQELTSIKRYLELLEAEANY